jgi:hypothetical protein
MLKLTSYLLLAAAVIITIATMVKATGGTLDIGVFLFILWAVSPYALLLIISGIVGRTRYAQYVATPFFITSLLLLAGTLFFYVGALNGQSSTEALIFVFAPLYLHVGAALTFFVGLIVSRFTVRTRV